MGGGLPQPATVGREKESIQHGLTRLTDFDIEKNLLCMRLLIILKGKHLIKL